MTRRNIKLISSVLLLLTFLVFQGLKQYPKPSKNVLSVTQDNKTAVSNTNLVAVTKVVDGDTIDVLINGKQERVRVLGINTPETVDPRKPVECFGKEASDKAKSLLTNQTIRLESDSTQSNKDKYGRLLRYVFINGQTDFGLEMLKEGYAYEYTYDVPYKYQKVYKAAQKESERLSVGLWGDGTCAKN